MCDPLLPDDFQVAVKKQLQNVGKGVDEIFSLPNTLHNAEFWRSYFQGLLFDLCLGLSICRGHTSEAEICHYLLTPLLKKIAHAASMSLAPRDGNCLEYCSALGRETQAAESDKRGRKPEVDYTMTGFVENDPMYIIPVEAKKKITEKHISQLSQYMGTLVNGRYVGGCTVGMLIDHSTVRLAFSPLATNDRQCLSFS